VVRDRLDYHAGRDGNFTGAETLAGRQDAMVFCFLDAKMASAFVDRFACGLLVASGRARGAKLTTLAANGVER